MQTPVIFSLLFDGNGRATALRPDQIDDYLKDQKLAWVHLDANHAQARPWLEEHIGYLDSYVLDALLAEETRPRMTQVGNGAVLILRGVNLNENEDPEDMVSLRMWICPSGIVSMRKRKVRAVTDIKESLEAGTGPRDAGEFVSMLVERLFERMQPVLSSLDDRTDGIEESVLESTDSNLREEIVGVRKQAILFRRYMAPQRDAIAQLRLAGLAWISSQNERSLVESHNHISRYVEDLDAIRERAQIIKDEISNLMSERLNKNTYVLSVVAAIFLPLGFLTGLLGINVGGIPGSSNEGAFAIFCAILVLVVALQVLIFKKMKWF